MQQQIELKKTGGNRENDVINAHLRAENAAGGGARGDVDVSATGPVSKKFLRRFF
ncbi:hypothetical protein [Acidocella sp.]|jgi:hypothetical protein|uniref:hypothetical protein n=1 Tax=Acidocella sp. TaxID=50710 RepID=UPI0038CFDEDA